MPNQHTVGSIVADVGGTHVRFAWCSDHAPTDLQDIRHYYCSDFTGMAEAFRFYCAEMQLRSERLSAALACPCEGDDIALTNNHWSFSRKELVAELRLQELRTLNDFSAQALAVPLLRAEQCHVLHRGVQVRAPILVMGPGTGLGVGGLVPVADSWIPVVTEGGHVTVAAFDARDTGVIEWLREEFGHLSAERLISGPGLVNLHRAELALAGGCAEVLDPAEIIRRAIEGSDLACVAVLQRFCRVLGGVVGNAAISLGARGGVVITGGIVPRILTLISHSDFLPKLHHKGRFSSYLHNIPVTVVVFKDAGLLGSAAALNNEHLVGMGYVTRA